MNKAFKEWHENAVLITSVPICVLNKICSEFYDEEFHIYTKQEDQQMSYELFKDNHTDCVDFKDYCDHWYGGKISFKNLTGKPSNVILSEILGIKIFDIYWDDTFGYSAYIEYRIKG